MSELGDWIREARARLETARAEEKFPRVERPPWMVSDDRLSGVLVEQERLLREGVVVWCAIVQANNELYHRGWIDMPAFVVHGSDRELDDEPRRLEGVGTALSALRGSGGSSLEERSFAALLRDELDRSTWRPIPGGLAPVELRGSAVLIVRRWLPSTTFANLPFPLLVHPSRSGHVLPLPQDYWPAAMRERWKADEPAPPEETEELRTGGLGFLFPVGLVGALVFVPALVDRVALWVGEPAHPSHRWFLTFAVPGLAFCAFAWLRNKFRKSPPQRFVYAALEGHEIKLRSDDEWGMSLTLLGSLLVIVAMAIRTLARF